MFARSNQLQRKIHLQAQALMALKRQRQQLSQQLQWLKPVLAGLAVSTAMLYWWRKSTATAQASSTTTAAIAQIAIPAKNRPSAAFNKPTALLNVVATILTGLPGTLWSALLTLFKFVQLLWLFKPPRTQCPPQQD